MSRRFCPGCNVLTDADTCPACGGRTVRERAGVEGRDPLIGRVLEGRYRVESIIGRGGMGTVYRGVQLATKRDIALKVIRPEWADEPSAVERFLREGRAASLLSHPHTIRILDFGESDDGDLFLVLEFLSGRTLRNVLKAEGFLPEARAAKIACEIAQSLAEAHQAGLIHRDLKPENVMLVDVVGDPDFTKVLDFGIAKSLRSDTWDSPVTRAGQVVGTPQYMAPEQALAESQLTPAVDIYGLGVMLFEMLSGQLPITGSGAVGIMLAHVRDAVPELPASAGVSGEVRDLVRRMLTKDPQSRPSAEEVVRVLERARRSALVNEESGRATAPSRPTEATSTESSEPEDLLSPTTPMTSASAGLVTPPSPTPPVEPRRPIPRPLTTPNGVATDEPHAIDSSRRGALWTAVSVAIIVLSISLAAAWIWIREPPRAPAPAPVDPGMTAGSDNATQEDSGFAPEAGFIEAEDIRDVPPGDPVVSSRDSIRETEPAAARKGEVSSPPRTARGEVKGANPIRQGSGGPASAGPKTSEEAKAEKETKAAAAASAASSLESMKPEAGTACKSSKDCVAKAALLKGTNRAREAISLLEEALRLLPAGGSPMTERIIREELARWRQSGGDRGR